ncbi:MAG: murein biosynthesis integral membrane protein MurJ [Burkholderiaceae bacterium]|nr:MAG: murein biosynthesis integral membrane protein MurJ [Burkholderiaceae bacterium]
MSLIRSASIVSLLTLASRITGLARDLLMAAVFGVSGLTDAFNVAFRIPNLMRRLFAEGAFSQAFVPVLASSKARRGDAATQVLIDAVATVLVAALILVSIAGVIGAPVLMWVLASGLKESEFAAGVLMTRVMVPYIACMSLVALSAGVLNTWRHFAVPAATPILLNLSMIVAAWFGAPWFQRMGIEPIYVMAVGVMAGGVLQLAVQIPALAHVGVLPRIRLGWRQVRAAWGDAGVQQVLKLMLPALLGVGVAQLSLLINTQIASYLAVGSVTWLFYADRLMEFPTALLGVALGVVLTPQLAGAYASGDHVRYSKMLDWGLRLVLLLTLPCAAGLLMFATPLVATLFYYGRFSVHDVERTAFALVFYGVGLVGLVGVKVLAPGYYAKLDIRTPVRIAIVVLVVTQMFNAIFVPFLQHAALTLSISLGALLNAGWLLRGLIRRGSYRPEKGWKAFGAKVIAATLLLCLFLGWAARAVNWVALPGAQRAGFLVLALLGAALVYFGSLAAFGMRPRQLLRL